jgi:hypothetical protein
MLPTLALLGSVLAAQAPSAQWEARLPSVTTLHVENDVLGQSDRFYTNGLRLEQRGEYAACGKLARALGMPDPSPYHRYLCGGSLAQNIYTPSRIVPQPGEEPWPDPADCPYGGWLHGGFLFQHLEAQETPTASSRLTLQATVGVTGPPSGAAQAQRGMHSLLRRLNGKDRPHDPVGWEAQLPTEPAFFVSGLYERPLLWSSHVDATASGGAALGTAFTHAGLGGTVRVGWLARPFGLSPIMPSLRMARLREEGVESEERILAAGHVAEAQERTWEAYLFLRGQLRLVARNLFLDGTFFQRSPSVRKVPLVGDTEFGAAARAWRFQVDFSMVFRSQEMADPPLAHVSGHRFLQLQLSYLR